MLTRIEQREIRELWKKHGGDQHGPNVETVTMPLEHFHHFMEDYKALLTRRFNWDHVAGEMGRDHAEVTMGPRP